VSTIIKKGEERKKRSLRHLRRSCKKLEFPASTIIKKGEERKKRSLRHLRRSCKKLEFPASTKEKSATPSPPLLQEARLLNVDKNKKF
jgi:hypothetical protein